MPVFRVERNKGYTVMSNHHLRNKDLSLKAKGLMSQMLSLPEDWDYTLKGLALINREKIDAIRQAIRELEQAGYGVHFIAVNDGVDSIKGDSEFTAIRNVFNEMFAKDTSKKIKATWQSKGRSGEHLCTIPPYGYMKDPEDKKRWIVDEEAAAIVQKIFALCVDGLGPTQIAKWLQQNNVLNPTAYAREKGLPVCNAPTANPCKWTNETVSRILERVEYLGHTVNFKTSKPSFKSKKKVWNNPSEWVIFLL